MTRMSSPARPDESIESRPLMRRLVPSLGIGTFSIYVVWGGVPGVLLALQIAAADPGAKELNLAIASGIGGAISVFSQPVWGMLSDRCRSRFGRRSPYILAGAVLTAGCLLVLAVSDTVLMLILGWAGVQMFLNMSQAPLSAVVPDRVPRARRGTVSAVIGIGLTVGVLGGQLLASGLSSDIPLAYTVLAAIVAVSLSLFVVLNREGRAVAETLPSHGLLASLRGLWVSPRKHPDFAWMFFARAMLMVGYFAVSGYQLYILSDYIGLGEDAVAFVPVIALTSMATTLVSMLVCGPLSDKLRRRKVFVIASSAILGIGLFVPFLLPTVEGMIIYAAVGGLGFGCYAAVDAALFTEVLPADADAAKDLGIANIASSVPQIIAPAVAGVTIALTGGYAAIFVVALVAALLGAAAVAPVRGVR